jgi:MFS family permease
MSYSQLLRIRTYRNLWLGQAISQLGDSFYYIAFMFMVQKFTGSIAMVGYVGAAETIPFLLFSLYGGVLADRIDRRKIMLASDLLSGVSLCSLALLVWALGKPPIWSLLVLPFALSTVRSCFLPAKNAAIPSLVPSEALLSANAFSALTQNIMPTISLSLSAGVLSLLYDQSPALFLISAVLLNSLSFFGSAFFIAKLPALAPNRVDAGETHPWSDLKDGLRYIRSRRTLAVFLCLQTGVSLAISPFMIAYVAANNEWFGGKPQTLALCEMLFFLGMVIGSYTVGRLRYDKPGAGFIYGASGVGLTVLAMAFSRIFSLFLVWNLAAGLLVPVIDIPIRVWIQATVPDGFLGRVNSLMTMIQAGVAPLGLCLGGIVIAKIGIAGMFFAMGGGMALAALTGLVDREFRTLEMPSVKAESAV